MSEAISTVPYSGGMITNLLLTVDELTYRSYRAQRVRNPETSPERWKVIYGPQVQEMEQRFQKEK